MEETEISICNASEFRSIQKIVQNISYLTNQQTTIISSSSIIHYNGPLSNYFINSYVPTYLRWHLQFGFNVYIIFIYSFFFIHKEGKQR